MTGKKPTTSNRRSSLSLGRRALLKYSALGTIAAATIPGVSSAADYEEIVVPAGQIETITLNNETYENKLIDITAFGAGVQFSATNSTIRNVGIRGKQPSDAPGTLVFVVQAEEGEEMILENVYFGDGLDDTYGGGGIFVHRNHAGHCIIDNCHIAHVGDNGIYASAPGQDTAGHGTVEIRNSLSHNNTVSLFRLGSAGSEVYNSVGWVDKVTPEYRDPGASTKSRGMWHWYEEDIEMYDVHIDMSDDPGEDEAVWVGRDGGHLHIYDCEIIGDIIYDDYGDPIGEYTAENIGDEPDRTPPEGTPQTPEDAATGAEENWEGRTFYTERIYVDGTDSDGAVSYELSVTGEPVTWDGFDATDSADATIESTDDGWTISGTVDGEAHGFLLNGEVSTLDVDDESVAVIENGGQLFPGPSLEDLPNLIEIRGDDIDEPADYFFQIDESPYGLGAVTDNDAVIDDDYQWIDEDEGRVAGRVHPGERHAYRFQSQLLDFSIEGGDAEALLDGETIRPLIYNLDDDAWKDDIDWDDVDTGDDDTDPDDPSDDDVDDDTDPDDDDADVDDADDDADRIPGFSVGAAIASIAGGVAVIRHRLRSSEENED